MEYRYALLAAVLAGAASSAPAQVGEIVELDKACPAGTFRSVASYSWKDGGFVFDGWLCESLYTGG